MVQGGLWSLLRNDDLVLVIFGLRILDASIKRKEQCERPEGHGEGDAEGLAGFRKIVERHMRNDEHLTFFYGLDHQWFPCECESTAVLLFIVEDTANLVEQGSL
jgi:hypothetical protein